MGIHGLPGLEKGRLLMDLRRQQEPFKVKHIADVIKQEIDENPNRQVIVYTSRVNSSSVTRNGETIHSSQGTPALLKRELERYFKAKIGELHGGSVNPARASMDNFQAGRTNTLIATMERGGVGVDLDDQRGDRPRTMIIMTAPFAGDRNLQALGRIWRASTKTPHGQTRVKYFFADTEIDEWNRNLIAGKMRTLGAVVEGVARDYEIPFDIGEEGLLDLAKRNQSERERHRDMIARGQMKQPYQWRQLAGIPQQAQESQQALQGAGLEGLAFGKGKRAKQDKKPKGVSSIPFKKTVQSTPGQSTMFRQPGEPERYASSPAFNEIHPRDDDTKRFIPKHKSLTLAQTIRRPPTPGEKSAYREYVEFLKVGGTRPLPFRKWLEFHRAETLKTLHRQQETPDDDSAEEVPETHATEQDSQPARTTDEAEGKPEGFTRSVGSPTRHSLRALHDFAAAAFDTYYQDSSSE
jgi:hypothetical protein